MTNEQYSMLLEQSKKEAIKLGEELANVVKERVNDVSMNDEFIENKHINTIFIPLVLEPIISALDYGYEQIGQCNFKWVIDRYLSVKIRKVIPLLIEVARKLDKGKYNKDNKADGGGPDYRMWNEKYSKSSIDMRWDTQSLSYYIELSNQYNIENEWTLEVSEYELGKKRKEAKASWEREPGYVLKYKREVEYAWLNLEKINRFLDLVNPSCTVLGIDLYKEPFVKKE